MHPELKLGDEVAFPPLAGFTVCKSGLGRDWSGSGRGSQLSGPGPCGLPKGDCVLQGGHMAFQHCALLQEMGISQGTKSPSSSSRKLLAIP